MFRTSRVRQHMCEGRSASHDQCCVGHQPQLNIWGIKLNLTFMEERRQDKTDPLLIAIVP